jgi:FixJ family two-component response regulator
MNDARKSAKAQGNDTPVVYVVDDDPSIREALVDLFLSVRTEAQAFESAHDLMDRADINRPGCILLDVQAARRSAVSTSRRIWSGSATQMPIIFMTGFGDIPMTVRAMKAGAVDFLDQAISRTRIFSMPSPRRWPATTARTGANSLLQNAAVAELAKSN